MAPLVPPFTVEGFVNISCWVQSCFFAEVTQNCLASGRKDGSSTEGHGDDEIGAKCLHCNLAVLLAGATLREGVPVLHHDFVTAELNAIGWNFSRDNLHDFKHVRRVVC